MRTSPTVTSMTTLDGVVTVTLRLWARNTEPAAYEDVRYTLTAVSHGEIIQGQTSIPLIGPLESGFTDVPLVVELPEEDLAAFIAEGLSAVTFQIDGATEVPVFADNVHTLWEDTDLAFVALEPGPGPGETTYWFDSENLQHARVAPGDVVIDGDYRPVNFFCSDFPFPVVDVLTGTASSPGVIGWVRGADPVDPLTLYDSAAVEWEDRNPVPSAPPLAPGGDDSDWHDGPAPTYVRFNDVPLGSIGELSGGVGVRVAVPKVALRIREGTIAEFEAEVTATLAIAMDAEIELAGTESVDATIGSLTIPISTTPIGPLTLTTELNGALTVQGDAAADGRVDFGGLTTGTLGAAIHYRRGSRIVLTPISEFHAEQLSDPYLLSEATAQVSARAGFDAALVVSLNGILDGSVGGNLTTGFDLDVDALAADWWTITPTTEGTVYADLTLLGSVSTAYAELPLSTTSPNVRRAETGGSPGYRTSGEDVRWTRMVEFERTTSAQDLAVLDGRHLAVVSGGNLNNGYRAVSFFDPLANHLVTHESYHTPHRVVASSAGDAVVVSGDGKHLSRFDADGVLSWHRMWSFPFGDSSSSDVAVTTSSAGAEEFLTLRTSSPSGFTEALLARHADNGDLLWARQYARTDSGRLDPSSLLGLSDGGALVMGHTQDAAPGISEAKGLIMKVDEAGDVVWSHGASGWSYQAAVELPDGDVIVFGDQLTLASTDYHAWQLMRVTPDGALRWMYSVAGDVRQEGRSHDPLSSAPGDSAWDNAFDIALIGNEVVLVGDTNISEDGAAMIARFTTDGEPRWLQVWDGDSGYDAVRHVEADGDRLVFFGQSTAFDPTLSGYKKGWLGSGPHELPLWVDPTYGMTGEYWIPSLLVPIDPVYQPDYGLYPITVSVTDLVVAEATPTSRDGWRSGAVTITDVGPVLP